MKAGKVVITFNTEELARW